MADIFDFDEEELSSKLAKGLTIVTNEKDDIINGYMPIVNEDQEQDDLDNRLGTSYEVNFDEIYEANESRQNSSVNVKSLSTNTPKKLTIQDFEPIKVLGKGSYGKVILVKDKENGKLFAQKQLKKASMIVNTANYERTLTERTILERVRHPNIVKLYYALQDFDKVYLMLEYLEGGELFHHLSQERILSEKVACFYIAEMILALRHLHMNAGVIYRDLKPENCMLNRRGHLVLTDFGLSKVSNESNSLFGTAQYIAPEVIKGETYDSQCDWWSLGTVLYDLLTGSPPFTGNNNKKIMDKVLTQKVKFPFYLSQDARDLLSKLLNKNPAKRLNCDTNFDDKVKTHRFFRYINWDLLIHQNDELQPPPLRPIITNPELAENFDEEFTSMKITPPSSPLDYSLFDRFEESRSDSTSSYITIKKPKPNAESGFDESVYFNNFSYTHEETFLR
ncbi:hypothetical protein CANARDRAFT_193992 [[Candida] arabinofermentans NRRL YB-2248]|uniref:Protein kinase domain-containing protein n=1 Tax=[Candida] arabinofermentans NRRL YB-2248 TaxID=983967 RepID=A0A1E4T975_9ASCO|nr:hypothetical protein CANARDRAFT_193992 [[Candida] arabinofermentans NRRL YB-2248]